MNPRRLAPTCREIVGENTSCHGVYECLGSSSTPWRMSPVVRVYQKFGSYLTWWLENLGWRRAFTHILASGFQRNSGNAEKKRLGVVRTEDIDVGETLGLQPDELVEVRPIDEILATLNRKRRCKGLLWMTGMRKYCGKQYRVRRRVERIMLETNGELRNMKNTVLLEDVMCDGTAFGGCDRCCFHFWREAWLERVPADEDESGGDTSCGRGDSQQKPHEEPRATKTVNG